MDMLTSLTDVQQLIDNEVPEGIFLDYKASPAIDRNKRHEIARDVSAFANSAGGRIIYGVLEDDHLPVRIDDGVDHNSFTREWLEQVILSSISPRLAGLRIAQIPIDDDHSVYVISVEQTVRGPHQVQGEGRYYKRFNFQSVPMEHYEIEDVRSRVTKLPPLISIDVEFEHSTMAYVVIRNVGTVAAEQVRFEFKPSVKWQDGAEEPRIFREGARSFPAGREMRFFYGTFPEIAGGKEGLPQSVTASVRYRHPVANQEITDSFHIDFLDFLYSSSGTPDVVRAAERIEKVLKDLLREAKTDSKALQQIANLASATGLQFSVPTLRSVRRIVQGEEGLEKVRADYASYATFQEVLGANHELAYRLHSFFSQQRNEDERIEDIEGMTPEMLHDVRRYFYSTTRDI